MEISVKLRIEILNVFTATAREGSQRLIFQVASVFLWIKVFNE